MFKLAINSVRAAVRIQRLKYTPEALSVSVAVMDPYRLKALRKVSQHAAPDGARTGRSGTLLGDLFVYFVVSSFFLGMCDGFIVQCAYASLDEESLAA